MRFYFARPGELILRAQEQFIAELHAFEQILLHSCSQVAQVECKRTVMGNFPYCHCIPYNHLQLFAFASFTVAWTKHT
jgi:hypothetical protein